ncbi:MAG TPA: mannose-1-phosphate guanylyltransferase [Candidatus Eisenbacteria bacterium]|nr:mannose-1-phosphate guanylyltransferase [Candidatus Eisenbacteria bacterium]
MRLHPVILAGGRGERFWPLSRHSRPKQLLPLVSEKSMVEETIGRLAGLAGPERAWILTAMDLRDAIRRAAPGVPDAQIVGEPVAKNTAPAIALAAWWLRGAGSDAVVAVLPSDHRVEPAERFRSDLEAAARIALERRVIVTIGLPPTRPETGYGYIEAGEPLAPGSSARRIAGFREKPDPATAARYASDGKHLWNGGMFLFAPEVMLEELRAHAPDIAALLPGLPDSPRADGSAAAVARFYEAAPSISIDYAVMEKTSRAVVIPSSFAWDDLGSWAALADSRDADASGNVARGETLLEDSSGVIAFSDGGLIATLGVKDLVIVRAGDVTLVCPRERAQEVRTLVQRLKQDPRRARYL